MFVSGGENIHPEEIESAMMSLGGVHRCIVVPVEDQEFGQRPVAFVSSDSFRPAEWEADLREQLAGYKVPKTFHQWPDEELGTLKPSRRWFAEQAQLAE